MTRIEQLFNQLGYNRENGLFYLSESEDWIHKFPYRISKVLRDIIQPFAFYSLHHHGDIDSEHPEPINNPIILFFDKPDETKRAEIPKWSFCFGQAPVVIINSDDTEPLDIYHGYKFESDHNYLLKNLNASVDDFSLINLTLGKTWKALYHRYFKNVPKVDKYLLSNIIDARRILVATDGYNLSPKVANRLIGRLLFIRYLIDRRVAFKDQSYIQGDDKLAKQASLNQLIQSKDQLYSFFQYLTNKYKGDLFPLKEDFVDEETGEITVIYDEINIVTTEHLEVLYHLFSGSSFFRAGTSHKGYTVQPSLFMVYDFEVIPVELISNIYENFIGKEDENINVSLQDFPTTKQYEIKAYYTPPFIVDYILSQTVGPFLAEQNTASCKILDPACGSGIFLVETLRKIIEKEIIILGSNQEKLTNKRLWQLLKHNIFGVDIDEDAIEITIFSLYITLLDYKTPIEIEDFKFERLKSYNLFGGSNCDFFNEDAPFNKLFTEKISLDFIVGNPPWGVVKSSVYEKYITDRRKREQQQFANKGVNRLVTPDLAIEIGNKEISQAFLVRVSDFASNPNLKVGLVVSGKNLYNSDSTSKNWREYFLSNFLLTQVLELSCVNNKIVGGNQIFEEAKMAPAILFYEIPASLSQLLQNVVKHITVKPNRFFNYFRTIVIEKHDIKKIQQRKFIPKYEGYDWLWKVMLHGNLLDFLFMLRLKKYTTIGEYMDQFNLDAKGGLKIRDGERKTSTDGIRDYKYIEVESRKEFKQYRLTPTRTWQETIADKHKAASLRKGKPGRNRISLDGQVGFLPDVHYFTGEKLLVKKGLEAKEDFKAVAAYTKENVVFTATICSIKPKPGVSHTIEISTLLQSLAGIVNSPFFTYYVFNTSSSAGIDRTRIDFDEIFSAPAVNSPVLAEKVLNIQNSYRELGGIDFQDHNYDNLENKIKTFENDVQKEITANFEITEIEQSLIDYATDVAIPILKRSEESGYGTDDIFRSLSLTVESDKKFLEEYAGVFIDHFKFRFNSPHQFFFVNIHIAPDFIGFHFIVDRKPSAPERVFFKETNDGDLFSEVGSLGIHSVTKDLYIQQDVRGFNQNTFYIIKPNEKKCWHRAVAHHDLLEFIDALARAETLNSNSI